MPYVRSKKTDGKTEDREVLDSLAKQLADGIAQVSKKYNYDAAFLGEMNFALTRLIQHLPRSLMETGQSKEETKYWLQASLMGVLLDVVLEYKIRVNQSYEIAQIKKNGDCYDTPYYSRTVEVVDEEGKAVGDIYVNVKRSDKTLTEDVLTAGKLVLKK